MSEEADTAAPALPRPRRNWGALVVALVIGLVVGTGGATLVWTLAGAKDPAEGIEGDVAIACTLVRRATFADKDRGATGVDVIRVGSALGLARGASISDSRYEPLTEALEQSSLIYAGTYATDDPEFQENVRKARQFCDAL